MACRSHLIVASAVLLWSLWAYPAHAQTTLTCRGNVAIPNSSHFVPVIMSISDLSVGGVLGLNQPITMDTEQEIELKIRTIQKSSHSWTVIAESANPHVILSFRLHSNRGTIVVSKFKGFEENSPFGPGDLMCER
jgi:hypothetical protein